MKHLLLILTLLSELSCLGQFETNISIFFASPNESIWNKEIDISNITLDSLFIKNTDIIAYDTVLYQFQLTEEKTLQLRTLDYSGKYFCITKNNERLLAGVFWPCDLSLGTKGFVMFPPSCASDQNFIRILYGLPCENYPKENDPRKLIK